MVTNYAVIAELGFFSSKVADRSVIVNTSLCTNLSLVGFCSEIIVNLSNGYGIMIFIIIEIYGFLAVNLRYNLIILELCCATCRY